MPDLPKDHSHKNGTLNSSPHPSTDMLIDIPCE